MNRSSYFGKVICLALATLVLPLSSFSQPALRTAMDMDEDGKADLAIFRPDGANWWVLKSGGGFIVQNWGDPNDDLLTPGDYDGDGKGDIAIWRDSTGEWWRINSNNSTISVDAWGTAGDEPVARDYDGDGTTDLAVVRNSGGGYHWWVRFFSGPNSPYTVTEWGRQGDFLAPGDYDGDHSFDFAIQRPGATLASQSTFWIKNSQGISTVDFGIGTDLNVPGDYDGDGKTDIAVVREGSTFNSNLVWYIRKSSDPGGGWVDFPWGVTGTDLTAQNDYDGDGRTEIAIWRNTDGTFWYKNIETSAFNTVRWGAPNDRPVANYDTH